MSEDSPQPPPPPDGVRRGGPVERPQGSVANGGTPPVSARNSNHSSSNSNSNHSSSSSSSNSNHSNDNSRSNNSNSAFVSSLHNHDGRRSTATLHPNDDTASSAPPAPAVARAATASPNSNNNNNSNNNASLLSASGLRGANAQTAPAAAGASSLPFPSGGGSGLLDDDIDPQEAEAERRAAQEREQQQQQQKRQEQEEQDRQRRQQQDEEAERIRQQQQQMQDPMQSILLGLLPSGPAANYSSTATNHNSSGSPHRAPAAAYSETPTPPPPDTSRARQLRRARWAAALSTVPRRHLEDSGEESEEDEKDLTRAASSETELDTLSVQQQQQQQQHPQRVSSGAAVFQQKKQDKEDSMGGSDDSSPTISEEMDPPAADEPRHSESTVVSEQYRGEPFLSSSSSWQPKQQPPPPAAEPPANRQQGTARDPSSSTRNGSITDPAVMTESALWNPRMVGEQQKFQQPAPPAVHNNNDMGGASKLQTEDDVCFQSARLDEDPPRNDETVLHNNGESTGARPVPIAATTVATSPAKNEGHPGVSATADVTPPTFRASDNKGTAARRSNPATTTTTTTTLLAATNATTNTGAESLSSTPPPASSTAATTTTSTEKEDPYGGAPSSTPGDSSSNNNNSAAHCSKTMATSALATSPLLTEPNKSKDGSSMELSSGTMSDKMASCTAAASPEKDSQGADRSSSDAAPSPSTFVAAPPTDDDDFNNRTEPLSTTTDGPLDNGSTRSSSNNNNNNNNNSRPLKSDGALRSKESLQQQNFASTSPKNDAESKAEPNGSPAESTTTIREISTGLTLPKNTILGGDDETERTVLPSMNAVDLQGAALVRSTTMTPNEGASSPSQSQMQQTLLTPATTTAQNLQDSSSKAATPASFPGTMASDANTQPSAQQQHWQQRRQLQPETPRAEQPMVGRINLNNNVSPGDTIVSYDSYESETGEYIHHSAKQLREERNQRRQSKPIQEHEVVRPAAGAPLSDSDSDDSIGDDDDNAGCEKKEEMPEQYQVIESSSTSSLAAQGRDREENQSAAAGTFDDDNNEAVPDAASILPTDTSAVSQYQFWSLSSNSTLKTTQQTNGSPNSASLTSSPVGSTSQQQGTHLSLEDVHSNRNNNCSSSRCCYPSQSSSSAVSHTSTTSSTTVHNNLATATDLIAATSALSDSTGTGFAAASLQSNSANQQHQHDDETSLNVAAADVERPETPEPGPTYNNSSNSNNNGSEQRPLQPAPAPAPPARLDRAIELSTMSKHFPSPPKEPFLGLDPFEPERTVASSTSNSTTLSRPKQYHRNASSMDDGADAFEKMSGDAMEDCCDDEVVTTHNQVQEADDCFGSPTESRKAAQSEDGEGKSLHCFDVDTPQTKECLRGSDAASKPSQEPPAQKNCCDEKLAWRLHEQEVLTGESAMETAQQQPLFTPLETEEEEAVPHSAQKKSKLMVYDDHMEEFSGVAGNNEESSTSLISTASAKKEVVSCSKNKVASVKSATGNIGTFWSDGSTATTDEIKDAGISDVCLQSEDVDNDASVQSSGASKQDKSMAMDNSLSNTHSVSASTDYDLMQTRTSQKNYGEQAASSPFSDRNSLEQLSSDAGSIPTNPPDTNSGGSKFGTSGEACPFSTPHQRTGPPKEVRTQQQQNDFASPMTPDTNDGNNGQVDSSSITLISGTAKDGENKDLASAAAKAKAKNTFETDVYNDDDDGKSFDDSSKNSNGEESVSRQQSTPRSSQSSDDSFPAADNGSSPSSNSLGMSAIGSNGSSEISPAANSSLDGSQSSDDDDIDPIIDGLSAFAPPNNSNPRVLLLLENLSKWIKPWSKTPEGEVCLQTARTSDQGFSFALVKKDDFKRPSSDESVSTLSSDSSVWDTLCTCGIVLKAFSLSSNHFSRDLRKEFKTPDGICSALIKYVRAQIVCAVGDDHDDMEYGEVCLLFSSDINPIQVYVEDPSCCQVMVSMENGTLTPMIFKAESITTIKELCPLSDKWSNLPDGLLQVLDTSDLVERHGSLLAGPDAFKEMHDVHGGELECGAIHLLTGGNYQRTRQSNCVLYCSVGPASSASGIGGDTQFHHTSVLALLVEHALNQLETTEDDATTDSFTSVSETSDGQTAKYKKILYTEYKKILYTLLGEAILESRTDVHLSITDNEGLKNFCKKAFKLAEKIHPHNVAIQRHQNDFKQYVSYLAKG